MSNDGGGSPGNEGGGSPSNDGGGGPGNKGDAGTMPTDAGGPPPTFAYYVSATGDDNNAGTLAEPWSITAFNTKMATYAGKNVGIIGDKGVIQYGRVGGVATSLYSLTQSTPSDNANPTIISIQGGSPSAPTLVGSCDSSGTYVRGLAVIDSSDPAGGALPSTPNSLMGQSVGSSVTQHGNLTIDGLELQGFTFAAINVMGPSDGQKTTPGSSGAGNATGLVIENCEIHHGGNIISNNNPGPIWLMFMNGTQIINNKIHDFTTTSQGSFYPLGGAGIFTFLSWGTIVDHNTFYDLGTSFAQKDYWQSSTLSYNYFGYGTFGSAYVTTGASDAVANMITGTGLTASIHHNVMLGPIMGYGEAGGSFNEGTINIYNNTFFTPPGLSAKGAIFDGSRGPPTGTYNFYNNLVYLESGYDGGDNYAGALTLYQANTMPSLYTSDYNAYGSGMTFATQFVNGDLNLSLSTWQGYGLDKHSTILSASPFSGTPAEPVGSSFAISGPATTAGKGGAACGALDGSGTVGSSF